MDRALVALLTFVVFAGINIRLALIGEASCGCFGAVSVSPWYAFGIDLAILVGLLFARPDLHLLLNPPKEALIRLGVNAICGLTGSAALLALLAGVAYWWFGSTEAGLAYLRGERLSVRPALVDAGEGAPGEMRAASVELVNWTDHAIHVVGGTADCSCVTTQDLPVTVPPLESRAIRVYVKMPQAAGMFTRNVSLITDDRQFTTVPFRLTGQSSMPAN